MLSRAGVARGALYHHFATKQALFDAVLDDRRGRGRAQAAGAAARAPATTRSRACAPAAAPGCEIALDPAIQRITLIDAPSVVGWTRWRELDEQHVLGGVRRNLQLIADHGRLARRQDTDLLAHMILAAVGEAALLIARADDPGAALKRGQAAVGDAARRSRERLTGAPGGLTTDVPA